MDQSFSHGLLYSVAPENFSELHLQDETKENEFEWEEQESAVHALIQMALTLFKNPLTSSSLSPPSVHRRRQQ
jgi:hypothetical protein